MWHFSRQGITQMEIFHAGEYFIIQRNCVNPLRVNMRVVTTVLSRFLQRLLLGKRRSFPVGICIFKVNNENTRTICEIYSKWIIFLKRTRMQISGIPEQVKLKECKYLWCVDLEALVQRCSCKRSKTREQFFSGNY